MTAPASWAPGQTMRGEVRRIAVLTVRDDSCACYLLRRLRPLGVELALFSQSGLKVEAGTPDYYRRLLRRRGPWVTLDNLALAAVKGAAPALARWVPGLRARVAGHGAPDDPEEFARRGLPPVLRPDPEIRGEPWLRYVSVDDINRSPDLDRLTEFSPDLLILGGSPILRRRTIRAARLACLNAHCGITPDYAGSAPFEWALFDRRFDDVGYTVHVVVPKVDAGPIVHQERVAWDPSLPNGALWPLLAQAMYDRLAEVASGLVAGRGFPLGDPGRCRSRPPAGLVVRVLAEARRRRYARTRVGG